MKTAFIRRSVIVSIAAIAAGCASVAVSNSAIEQNTAFALGLDKSNFTISDRVDDGIKSSYAVKTNSGKKYSCYVTGTVSVVGRVVSDAVCSEVGKSAKSPPPTTNTGSAPGSCNALLRAAGKCQ